MTMTKKKDQLQSACCNALKGYKLRSGEIIQVEDITIKEHFPETEDESTIEKWATVTAAVCARVMQSDIDEHSKMYSIARLENVVFSVSYKEEEFVVNIEVCC